MLDTRRPRRGRLHFALAYFLGRAGRTRHLPQGQHRQLSHEDLNTYMAQDPDGRKYQVVGDKYNWRCGAGQYATGAPWCAW